MKIILLTAYSFFYLLLSGEIFPQSIELNERDAVVWGREQNIKGRLNNFFAGEVTLNLNGSSFTSTVNTSDSSFSFPLILNEGLSRIIISADTIKSDTLKLTLGYNIQPEIYAYAEVNGITAMLHTAVIDNPDTSILNFSWQQDLNNPSPLTISNETDSLASVSFPEGISGGEYYFNLFTYTSKGDTVRSRTFITVDSAYLKAFDIKNDHAAWIDSAVIYEITPYIFANGNQGNGNDFKSITNKIPDFLRLGINTVWLQPVYSTFGGGQGYDVTNYFSLRSDYGTEQDLRTLIQNAKSNGIKVMFDFVPNHSSIRHPYAQNSIQFGDTSHYYNFYQREFDNARYSGDYRLNSEGFVYYRFLPAELVNLNYDNPEVRKWITEAALYWIKNFDIDGYRFDAVWGVNARNPEFMKELRLAVKRIKPEFLMLAEDKATLPGTFDEKFDAAYDWYPEEDWVSHWTWQTDYNPNANPTIFNYSNQNQRSNLLRESITNNGSGFAPNAKILRFLENNDLFHFITHHGLERTKMAAALEFSLHGIPLIYNGQEIGIEGHPYDTEFIFYPGRPLDYDDQYNLFDYYQNLIKWRKKLPALFNGGYEEISVSPDQYVFSFRRWKNDQNIFTVLNMGASEVNANLSIPVPELNLDSSKIYYLTDLISGEVISGVPENLSSVQLSLNSYTAKICFLADSSVQVTDVDDAASEVPGSFELYQNFPNPFNPVTNIKFNLPAPGYVSLKVFNILGEEAAEVLSKHLNAGVNMVSFDGTGLPSGIYIYRIESGSRIISKKMMLLK